MDDDVSQSSYGNIVNQPQSDSGQRNDTMDPLHSKQVVKPMGTKERLVDAEEEISKLKEENDWLDQEREVLTANLKQCQSELFALRPATQITDESLRTDLARIRQEIDDFVYGAMVDVEDNALYEFCVKQYQTFRRQKEPTELGRFIRKADINAWGPYPYSNFYILSIILEWILNEYVFKESYPLVINKARKEVLRDIEDGMRHSRQAEAPLDIARWRSESLMALTRLPETKHELARVSKNILRDVRSILSQWLLGAHASTKIEARFQRRILNPAIQFHQDFSSSYHRYTMEPIKDLSDLSPKEMLNEWHLKAADTWGQVKTEDQVGTALYCLHPGLVRRRPGGADPVTIVKPVVVITRPGTQRILNNQSKQEPVPSNATEQPALKESSSIKDRTMHPPNQDSLAETSYTISSSTDADSESDTISERESYDQDERRPPIGHIEEEQEQSPEAHYSESADVEASEGRHHTSETSGLRSHTRYHPAVGPGGVPYVQKGLKQWRYEETRDNPLAPRRASRGGGKDSSGEGVSHRTVNRLRQPTSGLNSVPSSPSSNSRGPSKDSLKEKPTQHKSTSDDPHLSTSRSNSVPTSAQSNSSFLNYFKDKLGYNVKDRR